MRWSCYVFAVYGVECIGHCYVVVLREYLCVFFCLFFVFFQAEDGIRDLVRSRGLGDVYKRQLDGSPPRAVREGRGSGPGDRPRDPPRSAGGATGPVSYTHLTLPTSDLV